MSLPRRGELWWWESPAIGRRPVVVLSRNETIPRLRRTIVAPCSTNVRGLDYEVALEPHADPVPKACVVSLASLDNAPIAHLVERIGTLSDGRMREICTALAVAVDCR